MSKPIIVVRTLVHVVVSAFALLVLTAAGALIASPQSAGWRWVAVGAWTDAEQLSATERIAPFSIRVSDAAIADLKAKRTCDTENLLVGQNALDRA